MQYCKTIFVAIRSYIQANNVILFVIISRTWKCISLLLIDTMQYMLISCLNIEM